jgi:hypothetical protein
MRDFADARSRDPAESGTTRWFWAAPCRGFRDRAEIEAWATGIADDLGLRR